MAFKEGDFLEIEFSEYDASNNELIATTAKAKEGNSEEKTLVIIGSGLLKGFERELKEMNVGDKKSFVLEPEDAYGIRDESKVHIMPIAEFRRRGIKPEPGMMLDIDGITNVIRSVGSGRVVVDANSIYAGKRIKYEVKVVNQITDSKDKINALAKLQNAVPEEIKIENGIATLTYMAEGNAESNIEKIMREQILAENILRYLAINEVRIQNRYIKEGNSNSNNDKGNKGNEEAVSGKDTSKK